MSQNERGRGAPRTQAPARLRRSCVQMFDLHEALRYIVRSEGSDLHLKVGSPPLARVHGKLGPIEGYEPLKAQDSDRVLREMLTDHEKLAEFEGDGEVDFAYAVE